MTHQTTSLDDFVRHTQWRGSLILDRSRAFFGLMGRVAGASGERQMDLDYAASIEGKAELRAAVRRARAAGFRGDMEGEGMVLGGVMVVCPNPHPSPGGSVVWARPEGRWGDKAAAAEVIAAARRAARASVSSRGSKL